MPHAVLAGDVNVRDVFERLEPVFIKEGTTLLKTGESFVSKDGQSILIESLVMDGPKKISFFTTISKRPDGLVIRIYPLCEVEKPKPVFQLIALIAQTVMKTTSGLTITKTNLQDYFQKKNQ